MTQTQPEPAAPPIARRATLPHSLTGLRGWWEQVLGATVDSPVLVKEFRTRMRGPRTYWVLLGYTLLLALALGVMYYQYQTSVSQREVVLGRQSLSDGPQMLGRLMYYFVFIAQGVMVALITPAITAGTITIEREQRSYELLVTTPLRPADLIRGKLSAAVSFVVLLLTASLPLVSLSFLVGGVSPAEIFFSYLIIALAAFLYGAIGIFWSAALRATAAATVVSYLSVLGLFLLTMVPGMVAQDQARSGSIAAPMVPFQSLNPVTATLRAVQPEYLFHLTIPAWVSGAVLNLLAGALISNLAMRRLEHFDPPRPFWTRLWCSLLWGSFVLFLVGPLLGNTVRAWIANPRTAVNGAESIGLLAALIMVLVVLVVPVFTSGDMEVRPGERLTRRYGRGFLPFRAFTDELSAGYPLVVGWCLFGLAVIPLGVAVFGKPGLLAQVRLVLPAGIMILAVVTGLAGIGNLLSVMLPSRWAACILTYLAAMVGMVLPYFTLYPWVQAAAPVTRPEPLRQLLYLVPFQAIWELMSPHLFRVNNPPMLFYPLWIVTAVIYGAVGLLGFFLTARVLARADRHAALAG